MKKAVAPPNTMEVWLKAGRKKKKTVAMAGSEAPRARRGRAGGGPSGRFARPPGLGRAAEKTHFHYKSPRFLQAFPSSWPCPLRDFVFPAEGKIIRRGLASFFTLSRGKTLLLQLQHSDKASPALGPRFPSLETQARKAFPSSWPCPLRDFVFPAEEGFSFFKALSTRGFVFPVEGRRSGLSFFLLSF